MMSKKMMGQIVETSSDLCKKRWSAARPRRRPPRRFVEFRAAGDQMKSNHGTRHAVRETPERSSSAKEQYCATFSNAFGHSMVGNSLSRPPMIW